MSLNWKVTHLNISNRFHFKIRYCAFKRKQNVPKSEHPEAHKPWFDNRTYFCRVSHFSFRDTDVQMKMIPNKMARPKSSVIVSRGWFQTGALIYTFVKNTQLLSAERRLCFPKEDDPRET